MIITEYVYAVSKKKKTKQKTKKSDQENYFLFLTIFIPFNYLRECI